MGDVETSEPGNQPAGPAARARPRALGAVALVLVSGLMVVSCAQASAPVDEAAGRSTTTTSEARPTTTERPTTTAAPTTEAPTTTAAPTTTTTAPPPTTTTVPPTTTTTAPPDPASDGMLKLDESGPQVAALQQRLTDLGYWMGTPDGTYGQLTRQAVMAFQKAEGLGRDGTAGPITQERLAVAGRPVPRNPSGDHIEIDLERQILLVVRGGQVQWAFNTSTGSGEAYTSSSGGSAVAATPPGQFTINRQIDGLREAPLGTLYRPKYFNGGIAMHGSGSIPANPASHGCARLTNSAMDLLWSSGVAEIGTPVLVY
jgi:peptidoglycan hydrolase-like protein with peptidoglycan-binding domain